jgi:polyferredoxin
LIPKSFFWIERQVEGDRLARIRLDHEKWPWGLRKLRLKITKHFLWLLIAVWTGNTFVGYFTPMSELSHSYPSIRFRYLAMLLVTFL